MRIPGSGERKESGGFFVATDDAAHLAGEAATVVERAVGVGWYQEAGSDVDFAALVLCRLRRAGAGVGGAMEHGDAAVRTALGQASPEALVWMLSRAISYMDETGFPDSVGQWFPDTWAISPEAGPS
jgi:hypothetical protein